MSTDRSLPGMVPTNVALTVHGAEIGPVVNKALPGTYVPPHPVTVPMRKFGLAASAQIVVLPPVTGLAQPITPPVLAIPVTTYVRGTAQAAADVLVPPLLPLQPQVKLFALAATSVAVPVAQRFALGATATPVVPLALPHTPLMLARKVAATVHGPVIGPVV